ncbi:MAG: carboxymuconolactone decarboxylase family protein [Chloroflexi bacterium]|nr:carboxymuconolactone decarboxylase family protein [Chloroflexota bacterium]MDL1883165.1 carboxymuconolactone decarboxylase family protein [Anaerolineae bacterium CFX8]
MTDLPAPYVRIREEFPEVAAAYDALGDAIHRCGPLDDKTRQLIKLALAVGGQLEGATHAHTRRALEMGISPEEIKHVILLAVTTLGFPTTVRAYTWIDDVLNPK